MREAYSAAKKQPEVCHQAILPSYVCHKSCPAYWLSSCTRPLVTACCPTAGHLYKASLPVQLHVQVSGSVGVWSVGGGGVWSVGGGGVGSVGGVAIYLRVTTVLRSPN